MDQIYRFLWFPRHYKLTTEALSVMIDRLQGHETPENKTVIETLKAYTQLHEMLTSHIPATGAKPYHEQLNTEQVKQIKTTLLLYLPILEEKRDKIRMESLNPKSGTEGIDQKIELAKKLINEKAFASLEPDPFLSN